MAEKTFRALIAGIFPKRYPSTSRKEERESQATARHAVIYSKRIDEARDYLDLHLTASRELSQVARSIPYSKNIKKVTKALEEKAALIELGRKKRFRIDTLNDPALTWLDDRLRKSVSESYDTVIGLIRMLKNSENIDIKSISEKLSVNHQRVMELISEMQSRLHKLARTVS